MKTSGRFSAWSAWLLLGLAVVFYAASLVFSVLIPLAKLGQHSAMWPVDPINLSLVAYAGIGALVAARRPRNPMGWIFLAMGLTWEIFALTNAYLSYERLTNQRFPIPNALLLPGMLWAAAFGLSPLLLLLFPEGRLPSPRWRPALWLLAAACLLMLPSNGSTIEAGSFSYAIPSLLDQLGLGYLKDPLQSLMGLTFLLVFITGIAALLLRLFRSRGLERQQMKWFCTAAVVFALVTIVESAFFDMLHRYDPSALVPADLFWGIPAALAFVVIPIAAAVAILRYRLYEIDVIIRLTLIYSVLTTLLALIYFGSVLLLEQFFRLLTGSSQSPVIIVLSTLAISALFAPLRLFIQSWIERRFYRSKYDAEQVLARFSAAARSEVDLSQLTVRLLDVANDTMQPAQIELWMRSKANLK